MIESKFIATQEKGEVSSLLIRPEGASWLLVLGHGASTNMRHPTLQTIAERLADMKIATFRYQFPYMERGRRWSGITSGCPGNRALRSCHCT